MRMLSREWEMKVPKSEEDVIGHRLGRRSAESPEACARPCVASEGTPPSAIVLRPGSTVECRPNLMSLKAFASRPFVVRESTSINEPTNARGC